MNLIISGTNRRDSYSLKVAEYYQKALKSNDQDWEVLSLESLPSDIITSDLYGKRSQEFTVIQQKITACEKFIFIIPEYNGSYPGILKTFIDACSYPHSFQHKKAALVGIASGKYGNIRGIEHFTGVCNYMRMHVLPLKIHIPQIHNELNTNIEFTDPSTSKFIDEQIVEITNF